MYSRGLLGVGFPKPGKPLAGVQMLPFAGLGQSCFTTERPGRPSVHRPGPEPFLPPRAVHTAAPALGAGSAVGRTLLLRGAQGKSPGEQRWSAAEDDQEGLPEEGTWERGTGRGAAGSHIQGAAPTKAVPHRGLAGSHSCAQPGVPCGSQKITLLPPSKSSGWANDPDPRTQVCEAKAAPDPAESVNPVTGSTLEATARTHECVCASV